MASTTGKRRGRAAGGPRGSYDPDLTRKALVDSALSLFGEKGFHATSVQSIVDHANVTKGAFYHHFETKEDVLALIHDEYLDAAIESLERAISSSDQPADQLRAVVREAVLNVARFRSHVAVYFQERRYLKGDTGEEIHRRRDAVEDAIAEIVRRGVAEGTFTTEIEPRIAVFGIVGMTAWTYQWLRESGSLDVETVADQFATMALRSLAV